MTKHICPNCGRIMHTMYGGKVLYCRRCKKGYPASVGDLRREGIQIDDEEDEPKGL